MAEPRYRVKLYGHTSGDPMTFCKNLAALLDIDLQAARAILLEVPVVLKEALDKEKAETFAEALLIMKGLCIVEPMERTGTADDLSDLTERALRSTRPRAGTHIGTDFSGPALRRWIPLSIGAAFLILFLGLYIATSRLMSAADLQTRPAAEPVGASESASPSLAAPYEGWGQEELEAEYQEITRENDRLQQLLTDELAALDQSPSAAALEPGGQLDRRRSVAGIRNRLRANAREMQVIERRMRSLERMQQ